MIMRAGHAAGFGEGTALSEWPARWLLCLVRVVRSPFNLMVVEKKRERKSGVGGFMQGDNAEPSDVRGWYDAAR